MPHSKSPTPSPHSEPYAYLRNSPHHQVCDPEEIVVIIGEKKPVKLMLYDNFDDDGHDSLRPIHYPSTDIVIICFSLVSPHSFERVRTKVGCFFFSVLVRFRVLTPEAVLFCSIVVPRSITPRTFHENISSRD